MSLCRCSHHDGQDEAEAEQTERQADGHLGGWGHGAFAAVSWAGGTKLRLLADAVATNSTEDGEERLSVNTDKGLDGTRPWAWSSYGG